MEAVKQHNILVWFLIIILVAIPLPFGSNQPMFWFYSQAAIQCLSVLVLALLAVDRIKIPPALVSSALPLSLFFVFVVTQFAIQLGPWGPDLADQQASRAQLLKTVCLFQLFCLTLLLINSQRRFKWLVVAFLVGGTFQAVYGTLMTVTGTEYIWGHEKVAYRGVATGTFVNRNHLAGYLEMTLALGVGLMISTMTQSRSRTWRQFFRSWTETLLGEKARVRICLVLMVIGLILTQSRMGNVAFFVGMGVAGLVGLFLFRKSHRGVVTLFASILIVDILLLGTFFGVEELQDRLEKTSFEEEQRRYSVGLSLPLLSESPVVGHGFGSFYTVFPRVRTGEVAGFNQHAHSDLVQFPLELGVAGTLPLLLLFGASFVVAIRVQMKRRNPFLRAMGFSATMAIISIGLHSATDFNLQIFANAATFVCILAMPWLAMYLPSERKRSTRSTSL